MALDTQTFAKLEAAASSFVTKNHHGYLAQGIETIQETQNPVAGLRLLHLMWGSSYASSDDQKTALNDVGKWLEDRLHRDPAVDVRRIELEAGWLRRLAVIAEAKAREERRTGDRGGPRGPKPFCAFGTRIESIEKRRADAAKVRAMIAPREESAKPAPPPPPTKLPEVFQVEFVDFADARDARKTARERMKKGRAPNPRFLPLRPTDGRFAALAANLACSTVETEGFKLPFEDAERHAGASRPFYVGNIEEREGQKVARLITLTAPRGQKSG